MPRFGYLLAPIKPKIPLVLVLAISTTLCAAQSPKSKISAASVPHLRGIERDLQAGRFREAQARAKEFVARQPDFPLGWIYLGMASARLNQAEQAIGAFERA